MLNLRPRLPVKISRGGLAALLFLIFGSSTPTLAHAQFTGCPNPTHQSDIPESECEALVAFYNNTDGPNWGGPQTGRWLTTNTPCNWTGITCEAGSVRGVRLISNPNIRGSLPEALGDLGNLESLILRSNGLMGSIPASLGTLANLTHLDLSINKLSDPIPDIFSELDAMVSIILEGNQLSGPIPPSMAEAASLEEILLGFNQLSGPIPPALGNLSNLKELQISLNELSGVIPQDLGQLENLEDLRLDGNQLEGRIPSELGNLTNLTWLSLGVNNITGAVPETFSQLTRLETFLLNENDLDYLPDLSALTALKKVHLQHNRFNFFHLEPLSPLATSNVELVYHSQDSVDTRIERMGNEVRLVAEAGGEQTTCRWFRDENNTPTHLDDEVIEGATDLAYTLPDPEDMGFFRCDATNALLPRLTLHSRPVQPQLVQPSLFPDGVAIDAGNPTGTPDQSVFNSLRIAAEGLEDVIEVRFEPSDDLIVSNLEADDTGVRFDLTVLHTAALGTRNLSLRTASGAIIDITEALGYPYIVTRIKTEFNQAIDVRELEPPFRDMLVSDKLGAIRLQLDDDTRFGESYVGTVSASSLDEGLASDFDQPYRYQERYSFEERLLGREHLVIPLPRLQSGSYRFQPLLTRTTDERVILGPEIDRTFIESRPLHIVGVKYRTRTMDGTVHEPASTLSIDDALRFIERVYPVSHAQLNLTLIGTRDLPSHLATKEVLLGDEPIIILTDDARDRLFFDLEEELKLIREKQLGRGKPFDLFLAFLPEGSLLADSDGDGMITSMDRGGAVGVAASDVPIALISAVGNISSTVAHEVGHVIAFALGQSFPIVTLGGNLGDEYEKGVFFCGINPPIQNLQDWNGTACPNSPHRPNVDGDANGLFTQQSAYNPIDQIPLFADPDIPAFRYNFMSAVVPEIWVSTLVYDNLYKTFFPRPEALAKTTPVPSLVVHGTVFDDNTAMFSSFLRTTTALLSEESGGAYQLQVQDDGGTPLNTHAFDVSFVAISEPPVPTDRQVFQRVLALPDGARRVVLSANGQVLAERIISEATPVVDNVTATQDLETERVLLNWTASDGDGDALRFSLYYRPDAETLFPIVSGLTEPTYTWDTSAFPASTIPRLLVIASDGVNSGSTEVDLAFDITTGIRETTLPTGSTLLPNYPNPFNATTTIQYALPKATRASLIIYDILGREVAVLVDGEMSVGRNTARFDASHLPSGVYFFRLTTAGFSKTRTMVLLR